MGSAEVFDTNKMQASEQVAFDLSNEFLSSM